MTGNGKLIFKAKDWGSCVVAFIEVNGTPVGKSWQSARKILFPENM